LLYNILADLIVILHLVFIIFNVLGGLLVFWKRWIAWVHIPAAFWGSIIIILGWSCPLTPLEQQLRILGGKETYSGSFISHYITSIIYPAGLTRETQIELGFTLLLINIVIYSYVIFVKKRRKGK
jgi:hypothetical protein